MSAGKPEKGSPLALWKERLTELFHRYQYALLVVAAGVVLMVLPALGGESKAEEPQQESVQEVEFGTEELEGRLERMDSLSIHGSSMQPVQLEPI